MDSNIEKELSTSLSDMTLMETQSDSVSNIQSLIQILRTCAGEVQSTDLTLGTAL